MSANWQTDPRLYGLSPEVINAIVTGDVPGLPQPHMAVINKLLNLGRDEQAIRFIFKQPDFAIGDDMRKFGAQFPEDMRENQESSYLQLCIKNVQTWRVEKAKADAAQATESSTLITKRDLLPFNFSAVRNTPWAVPNFAVFSGVSKIEGPGAAAKTQLLLQGMTACTLGKPFLYWTPIGPLRTALLSGEEDHDELMRRLYVIWRHMGLDESDMAGLAGRMVLLQKSSIHLVQLDSDGKPERTPFYQYVRDTIVNDERDILFADPFVELSSGLDENSAVMQEVHLALRDIARAARRKQPRNEPRDEGAAVTYVHHFRKSGAAGDQSSGRGSGTLTAGSRVVIQMQTLTADEAAKPQYALTPDERTNFANFIRMQIVKNNYGPRGPERLLEIKAHELPKGGDARPVLHVRDMHATVAKVFELPWLEDLFDLIDEYAAKELWLPIAGYKFKKVEEGGKKVDHPVRADTIAAKLFGITDVEAMATIKVLLKEGNLAMHEVTKGNRHKKRGLVVKSREAVALLPPDSQTEIPF